MSTDTSPKGKIRTRHWVFGVGLPIQGLGMALNPHTASFFDPQSLMMFATFIYGLLDWHKNSGKN